MYLYRIFALGIALTGLLKFSASAAIQPTDTIALPLDSCISIALSENPTIKVADWEIKRLDYSKKETLASLLPNISFGATYNRTLAKQTMYMNMSRLGNTGSSSSESTPAMKDGIKVGLDNSYSVGFSASMPLIAPQLWKSLKLSDSQILESVEKARNSRIELINQVKNAYYTLLLAHDSYTVIRQSYEMAKFTADLYEKKHSLGSASKYDVLRTQVAVKNVEPELTQALIAIRQASLQLRILMGIDASIEIKPAQTLAEYQSDMYAEVLSINKDLSSNPSIRLLDIQTQQLRDALTVRRMAWYPTLALSANYNWTSMSDGSPLKNFRWNPYSMVGLTLSVPLFQGGSRYSAIKQAEIQVKEMGLQHENLQRNINMQVDLAIDNINLNVKQIASCEESMTQAQTAHSIAKESFEIGAASYLDLRDAELALTQSRLAYNQSIYNYLVASSDLELLLGNADISKYTVK
ncbi:MAG: TolC family protein [Paramuribaculum sp.]|nr:TolC family protein [Paramuribaculum sp.]